MALNNKQTVFVSLYLSNGFNAAAAARDAGYSAKTARSQGARLLTHVDIAVQIRARIGEYAMSADEALTRLSDIARASMEYFIDPQSHTLDLSKAEGAGRLHLIKKFTRTTGEKTDHVAIELYDAQAALVTILKEQHLLKGEPTDITDDASLTDAERLERIAAIYDAARARRLGQVTEETSGESSA